jgi:hypothetical protein
MEGQGLTYLSIQQVLETARQVASVPVSSTPIPYDQMKSQCEALVTGKQRKMSVLHSFKHQKESKAIVVCDENEKKCHILPAKVSKFVMERKISSYVCWCIRVSVFYF